MFLCVFHPKKLFFCVFTAIFVCLQRFLCVNTLKNLYFWRKTHKNSWLHTKTMKNLENFSQNFFCVFSAVFVCSQRFLCVNLPHPEKITYRVKPCTLIVYVVFPNMKSIKLTVWIMLYYVVCFDMLQTVFILNALKR